MKKADTKTIALGAWVVFCVGEFVVFPQLVGLGFGVGGVPEEVKRAGNPDFYIWWMAVKWGLPFWLLATAVCGFVFFKNRA